MTPADLTAIRSKLGLSQSGLAAVLGVHVRTISKWERGVHPIPPYINESTIRVIVKEKHETSVH